MKRFAVGLLLLLGACATRVDDSRARRYQCTRDGGADQCPGDWRCGVDDFCQDPNLGERRACEAQDDCAGDAGWRCGLDGLCYDRTKATRVQCVPGGGNVECADGWRCGQDGLCYDRAAATDVPCVPDGGNVECADNWRCGLEKICHAIDAGAPYQCLSDLDCEAKWRCGPDRVCVDVAVEALQSSSVAIDASVVSPLLPANPYAVSLHLPYRYEIAASGGLDHYNPALMFSDDGGLHAWAPLPTQYGAVSLLGSTTNPAATASSVGPPEDLWLIATDAGIFGHSTTLGAPLLDLPNPISPLANASIRYARERVNNFGSVSDNIVAWGAFTAQSVLIAGSVTDVPAPPGASIRDLTFLPYDLNRPGILATSLGLYSELPYPGGMYVDVDGGFSSLPVFRPLSLPGVDGNGCAGSATPVDRIKSFSEEPLTAAIIGGDQSILVWSNGVLPAQPCAEAGFTLLYGPCAVCGPGERFIDFGLEDTDDSVVTLCDFAADGGRAVRAYRHPSGGACALNEATLRPAARAGFRPIPESVDLDGVEPTGMPVHGPFPESVSFLESSPPTRVAGGPNGLLTERDLVLSPYNQKVSAPSGYWAAGLGLERVTGVPYVAGSVRERPDLIISPNTAFTTGTSQEMAIRPFGQIFNSGSTTSDALGILARSTDLAPTIAGLGVAVEEARAFGRISTASDGSSWLVVAASDRVWADHAQNVLDGGGETIPVRIVPLPSGDIGGIAFTSGTATTTAAGPAPVLDGLVVIRPRVFRVRAFTDELWLPDEIHMPDLTVLPIAAWFDRGRGRIGTSDGRIFGSPIPVQLATAIPEAPLPTVVAMSDVCGWPIAVSRTSVYQLEYSAPPIGTWKKLDLSAVAKGIDRFGPHFLPIVHNASVGGVDHAYVFSETGLVLDLSATCP